MSAESSERNSPAQAADDLRQRGNFEFGAGRYDAALALYTAALEHQPESVLVLCNRSATYFCQEQYELARDDAQKAWTLSEQRNLKSAFRLAKTQLALREYDAARETLTAARGLVVGTTDGSANMETDDEATQNPLHQKKALEGLWQQLQTESSKKNDENAIETSIKMAQRPVSIREFAKDKTLGHGNFSEIVVVTHKVTGEEFALKMIPKKQAEDLAKRQHPNVYNEINMERRILLERLPPHPNVIRMYHAFQDYNTLYYLMDLHTVQIDLWTQLQWAVTRKLNTPGVTGANTTVNKYMVGCHRSQAVRWMAQLIDALEHLHRNGIVHRDLKTENILLNERGHVVVIDFGTAKDLLKTDLNGPEFVGTPDFMSPEAVTGTAGLEEAKKAVADGQVGAQHTADLWALGAVLYIMQTGMTPFWCASPYLAFLRIKRGRLSRPAGIIDDEAWDLISRLMVMEPEKRFGADAFSLSFANPAKKSGKCTIETTGSYDVLRQHPYFDCLKTKENYKPQETVLPTLRDLCVRPVAVIALAESRDVDLCEQHPPGDGSRHDLTRLSPRDKAAVLHVLDRRRELNDFRLYSRFFVDSVSARLDKVRPATRDFVGLAQMNDEQGKAPNATMNDPYAKPIAMDDIEIVHVTNPLFDKSVAETYDEETRKRWNKLFRKCIGAINRQRPKLVVATGFMDDKSRKLLARINDSIPVVAHDGSSFFTFWIMGIQGIALKCNDLAEDSAQVTWLREQMELCRMSKHPLFVFCDGDAREIPLRIQKRLARGRVLCVSGLSRCESGGAEEASAFSTTVSYRANEQIVDDSDNVSIRSDDSEEDEGRDNFTMKVEGSLDNGLRWFTVGENPGDWKTRYEKVES